MSVFTSNTSYQTGEPVELTDTELDHVVGGGNGGPQGGGPGNSGNGDKNSPVEGPPSGKDHNFPH
jgi:hypothetical protein